MRIKILSLVVALGILFSCAACQDTPDVSNGTATGEYNGQTVTMSYAVTDVAYPKDMRSIVMHQGYAAFYDAPENAEEDAWNLLDRNGNRMLEKPYLALQSFNEQGVTVAQERGFYVQLDTDLKATVITEKTYQDFCADTANDPCHKKFPQGDLDYSCLEDGLAIYVEYEDETAYAGLVDENGTVIIPAFIPIKYLPTVERLHLSEGIAFVEDLDTGRIGMITVTVGDKKPDSNVEKVAITQQEAYDIYYETIKKFTPELMDEPQECDVEIKTRHEVTYSEIHFVRYITDKVESQNVDGKLEFYYLSQFPDANKKSFYYIYDDKFYGVTSCRLNQKGELTEYDFSRMPNILLGYFNTPQFEQEAIKFVSAKKDGSDTKLTFVVDGSMVPRRYTALVMFEISPDFIFDKLDDVKIVLTLDENGVAKTMSAQVSMHCIAYTNGNMYASKELDIEYVFNQFDNVDFDLQEVVSQHAENPLAFE